MREHSTFGELIRRVRAGDELAATELVKKYEPQVRRMIRFRLNANQRRLLDSTDVSQSVLKSFFVRTAAGQFDLRSPAQLIALLKKMAVNKVIDHARKGRNDVALPEGAEIPDAGSTPSQHVGNRELLAELRKRLTERERQLADQRSQGMAWKEIADEVGGTADAVRIHHGRGVGRVTKELGLDDLPPVR